MLLNTTMTITAMFSKQRENHGTEFLCSLWRLSMAAVIAIYKNIDHPTIYKLRPPEMDEALGPAAQARSLK